MSIILPTVRNEAAKVWTHCRERLRSAVNGVRNLPIRQSLARFASKRNFSDRERRHIGRTVSEVFQKTA